MRSTKLVSVSFLAAALGCAGAVLGQNYDRIMSASDITVTNLGGGGGAGGWLVRATVWLANESPTPIDLGCAVNVLINGAPAGSNFQTVMVSNAGTGGSGCMASCVTDGWCAACKESIIVPGTCYCCNHSVAVEFVVPNLEPGDVVSASCAALPGAAAEIATGNDAAFIVVPTPGGYNRVQRVNAVHYGRTATGEYAVAGEVGATVNWETVGANLATDVLVLVNGTPFGGGGGGCGGGATTIITVGTATQIVGGSVPPLFSCAEWCVLCQHTNGFPNGNICTPQAPSNSPFCICDENCSSARIVPGSGWQVTVPQLNPSDQVTVIITPHPGSLPELDTSDDAVIVQAAGAALCPAGFADVGQQGGLAGGDGLYDNNDFVVFIGDFFNAHPRADLGKQGGLFGPDSLYDNNDFVVFIGLFFSPC